MIKVLELFAGIGACSKALERLGIEHKIVDAVEIDKYAIQSFNAIHGTSFEPQDITKWDKDIQVDLIMHGSPCQDFSVAGKQAGGDIGSGTRSSLMYETIRIVGKLRPKYIVWENVKNLLSKKHKHNFDAYIETINILGYNSYYQVLNAKDYGIPQNRERVFTISIRKDLNIEYSFPNKEILNKNLQELLESNVEEKYFLSGKGVKYVLKRAGKYVQLIDNNTEIAHCPITAKGNTNWTGNFVKYEFPPKEELKLRLKDMLEEQVEEKYYLSDKMISFFIKNEQVQKEKGNGFRFGVSDGNVIAKAVTTRAGVRMDDNFIKCNDKRLKKLVENTDFIKGQVMNLDTYNQTTNENISQCITEPHHNSQRLFDGLRIRKLTPKECWRLMGFDDEDFEKAEKVNSNTQLYKQARKLNRGKCIRKNIRKFI